MFVIGMELDFSVLKNKINETLVISHAGILVPFWVSCLLTGFTKRMPPIILPFCLLPCL
jgi:Kef-type K+ transport system membrane component KefB